MTRLILASGSVARARMLENAGIVFLCQKPDEKIENNEKVRIKESDNNIQTYSLQLASVKALSVSEKFKDYTVIGCDQVLIDHNNNVLHKPLDMGDAEESLLNLRGQYHFLSTAIVLVKNEKIVWSHIETPRLKIRSFSKAFLDLYLQAEGESLLNCAGSYKIEGLGAQLFEEIDGDIFSIQGLPLIPLLSALRQFGEIPS